MPGEWSSSTMVSDSVPGVFLLILVAVFMEEIKDDSELGPLCRELPLKKKKKSHVAKDSFPSWITSFAFCLHDGSLHPFASREQAKESPG